MTKYTFPELGLVVEADSLQEATEKARKKAKTLKDNSKANETTWKSKKSSVSK